MGGAYCAPEFIAMRDAFFSCAVDRAGLRCLPTETTPTMPTWHDLPPLSRPFVGFSPTQHELLELVRRSPLSDDVLAIRVMNAKGQYAAQPAWLQPSSRLEVPRGKGWLIGCPNAHHWLAGDLDRPARPPVSGSVWQQLGCSVDPITAPVRYVAIAQTFRQLCTLVSTVGSLEVISALGLVPVIAAVNSRFDTLAKLPLDHKTILYASALPSQGAKVLPHGKFAEDVIQDTKNTLVEA